MKITVKGGMGILILATLTAAVFILMYYFWIGDYFESVGSTAKLENSFAPFVKDIKGNDLYFTNLNTEDLSVQKIEINEIICLENMSFPNGENKVDISRCLDSLSAGKYELYFYTQDNEFKNYVYVN